jgi:hypothetical protein
MQKQPKTYTSLDAVGVSPTGVGKATVEELRVEKPLQLTTNGPLKGFPKKGLPVVQRKPKKK